MPIERVLEFVENLKIKNVILTHINECRGKTHAELESLEEKYGDRNIRFAYDGMKISFIIWRLKITVTTYLKGGVMMSKRLNLKKQIYSSKRTKKGYISSDFHFSRIRPCLEWVEDEMEKVKKSLKILDVGCSIGEVAKFFMDMGNEVYGIDVCEDALKEAEKKGVKTRFHDCEEPLPYGPETFDIVYAGQILEHIYDTDGFLKECERVLKKGGLLILSTPNIASLPSRVRLLFGFYPKWVAPSPEHYQPGDHIRAFTKSVLKDLVERCGFRVEKIISNLVSFLPTRRTSPPWSISLGKIFPSLGEILILKARKI